MRRKTMYMYVTVVAIVALLTLYAVVELAPPSITRISTEGQYANRTFAEQVKIAPIVLRGEIIELQIKTFDEQSFETDADGNLVVYETLQIPRTEIVIKIHDVLKTEYELPLDTITVHDREVSDAIGKINDVKTRFISQYVYDYQIGERGIFLIENDTRLWLDGFTSFYPIEEKKGQITIESEFDKKYNRTATELEHVWNLFE